jgi:hypothetical protein
MKLSFSIKRADRRLDASRELDVAAPRNESGIHFNLISPIVSHPTDCRKCLQRLAVTQACLGE